MNERRGVPGTGARTTLVLIGVLLTVLSAAPFDLARAQEDRDLLYSLRYSIRHRINDRHRGFWDLIWEKEYSSGQFFGSQHEFRLLGGIIRDLRDWARFEGAAGYYYIAREDADDSQEVRLWQATTFDWPESPGRFRRMVLHHRFRLEERFRERQEEWSFAMRLRYRLAWSFPVNRHTVEPGAFYIPTMAELYFPLGDDVDEFFTQRVRFTLGLGYVIDKVWKGEVRYYWQNSRDTLDQDLSIDNHYIQFRLTTSILIRDLVKAR